MIVVGFSAQAYDLFSQGVFGQVKVTKHEFYLVKWTLHSVRKFLVTTMTFRPL